jgi:hypothetical protein
MSADYWWGGVAHSLYRRKRFKVIYHEMPVRSDISYVIQKSK